jgi:hypothetical protein
MVIAFFNRAAVVRWRAGHSQTTAVQGRQLPLEEPLLEACLRGSPFPMLRGEQVLNSPKTVEG